MRRRISGLLVLSLALTALAPRAACAGAPDSAAAAWLEAAQSAARGQRWSAAESHARDALLSLPILAPDTVVLDGAIAVFVRARATAEPTRAGPLAAFAALDTFALRVYEKGLFLVARRMLERSLAHRESTLDTLDFIGARCAHLLGNVVFDLGDYELSRDHYLRAKVVYERLQGPRGKHVSMMRYNLSNTHYLLGDLAEARRLLLEVLGDSEARRDRSGIGDVYLNLGAVLGGLGDPIGARRALERCIDVRRSIGQSAEWIGDPFLNLAGTFVTTGDGARALALLDSASFHLAGVRPDHNRWALLAHARCDALRLLGRLAEAESEARRALELRESIFGPEHPDVADAHAKLAEVHRHRGDWAAALRGSERAAELNRRLLPAEHPKHADDRLQLARARLGVGDSAQALAHALGGEESLRAHLLLTAAGLGEAEAIRQDQARGHARDIALEVLSGRPSPADGARVYDAVVRSRASVLDLQMLRLHSLGEGPEVAALRSGFERACTRIANLVVRGPGAGGAEAHRAKLDVAYAERHRAELALAVRSASYQQGNRTRVTGLDDVLAALSEGAAIVSFVRYAGSLPRRGVRTGAEGPASRYGAFVARAGTPPVFLPLSDAPEVDSLVALTRAAMERGLSGRADRAYRLAAGALRRRVWDPLRGALRGAETVFLVPDGALQLVNFAAFPIDRGRYLVESGPALVILSTERDLVTRPAAGEPGSGLLVVGGVDFDRSSPLDSPAIEALAADAGSPALYRGSHSACADFSSLRLSTLPASAREAGAVSALWRSQSGRGAAPDTAVQALTGARASEDRFKRLAPRYRVLHVATHGFFVRSECEPRKDFADRPDRYAGPHENALLRSGLALAGFNARETAAPESEDGVLTAEEVAALDLSGVSCVVLSACESGVGDVVLGEGVFGLRRAFMLAGASTVVTSLTRIRDVPARAWTQAFYDAFAGGMPASGAATAASRAMLARARAAGRGTHPSEWGAFIAIGGWR